MSHTIKFYGTRQCLTDWKEELWALDRILTSSILTEDGRCVTVATITTKQRTLIQEKLWHAVHPGQDLRWNCRVTFKDLMRVG